MVFFRVLIIGSVLFAITTLIHAIVTKRMLAFVKAHSGGRKKFWFPSNYWLAIIVLILLFVTFLESGIWAVAYLLLNVIDSMEASFYFSLVSFTTLGFGDITLNENYRLLAAIEAANGIIIFGWSTAIVVAVVQHIFLNPARNN